MEPSALVEGLTRPSAYPHPVGEVEVRRTHISVVFLAGDFVYKVKKPVELGFLDYGTLERRRRFCEEEVRLNRRLAPDVYLGVAAVVENEGGLEVALDVDPDREVREWAVRMRRLPEERTLQALVEREAAGGEELERLATRIAEFHSEARRGPEVRRYGRFEVVAGNARDNFTQSEDQIGRTVHGDVFRRLAELTEGELGRLRGLIESRAERDVPRDTHGDLRLDHVYFLTDRERPVIIDCIEFNPAFRFADPVADMAFLVMDLAQEGRRDLAERFARDYFRASGDEEGRELLELYVAYRAAVRGKVQGIKALAGDVPEEERNEAAVTAARHWLLALGTLAPPEERPGLVLVGGLPATGKSTLARELAGAAGFEVIRSDVVRKELAAEKRKEKGADGPGASWGQGIYSPGWSDRTYAACHRRAEERLSEGGRVIVDASFHREERRREFLEAAVRRGARFRFLICEADRDLVRRRLEARTEDVSDADWDVYLGMEERWDRPGEPVGRVAREVPTGGRISVTVRRALGELREAGLL